MTVTKTQENRTLVFELDGWLDTLPSPELGTETMSILRLTGISKKTR